jgi:uncharacterized membrane protein
MAEKLNMGEVRCSGCKKIVKITDEYCPNCGAKTDPKGKLIHLMVGCLIVGLVLLIAIPIAIAGYEGGSILVDFLSIGSIIAGIVAIIIAVFAGVLIQVNKVMRKKAFEEMGVKEK